jgi:SHS2 domain-containing protein
MSYELRPHTADVAVAATGDDLGETFAAVADGLAAAMCDEIPETGERFSLTVRAEGLEALLFDYLDQLIYERDVRGVLPVANEATVSESDGEWVVDASARGVPLADVTARDVKAVTYSEMRIEEREEPRSSDSRWEAYVVLDV